MARHVSSDGLPPQIYIRSIFPGPWAVWSVCVTFAVSNDIYLCALFFFSFLYFIIIFFNLHFLLASPAAFYHKKCAALEDKVLNLEIWDTTGEGIS